MIEGNQTPEDGHAHPEGDSHDEEIHTHPPEGPTDAGRGRVQHVSRDQGSNEEASSVPTPEEIYMSYPAEQRRVFEEKGVAEKLQEVLRLQLTQNPDAEQQERMHALSDELNEIVENDPELQQALGNYIRQVGPQIDQAMAESAGYEEPESDSDNSPEPQELSAEDRVEVEAERARREQAVMDAINASVNDPLDVDKQAAAAKAIRHLKEHHDVHEAHHIENTNPWWVTLAKGSAVTLYMIIWAQYMTASVVESMFKGNK